MTDEQQRQRSPRDWLAEAAAAENQRFMAELGYHRAAQAPAAAPAGDDGPQARPTAVDISPKAQADAAAEDAAFQEHVRHYDPNLFRRGRRRRVEYDKPVGPKPETVADAKQENDAFLQSLKHWSPG